MFFDILPLIIEYMSPLQRLRARTVNRLFYTKTPLFMSSELLDELNIQVYHINKYTHFGSRFKWFNICDLSDLVGLCKEANVFSWRHGYNIPDYLLSKTTQVNINPGASITQYYGSIPICTSRNKITVLRCTPSEALDTFIRIWTDQLDYVGNVMTLRDILN